MPRASDEVATARRLALSASGCPALPVVPVLRVVDHVRSVLGTSMAVLVMPYMTPMLEWVQSSTLGDFLLAIASMGEVRCAVSQRVLLSAVLDSFPTNVRHCIVVIVVDNSPPPLCCPRRRLMLATERACACVT